MVQAWCLCLLINFLIQPGFCQDTNFRFANNYGTNMVLQRAPQQAVLWGFGEENQKVVVNVSIVNQVTETHVSTNWKGQKIWKVVLLPIKSFGPFNITASSVWQNKSVSITLENVLFGDVYVCSGQSNMEFTVGMSLHSKEEIEMANNRSNIRLFTMKQKFSKEPVLDLRQENILQNWTVASNASVGGSNWHYFSAVCWMFGRRLFDRYKVPIGLIASAWGGTCAEAWSPQKVLDKCGVQNNPISYQKWMDRKIRNSLYNMNEDDETKLRFQKLLHVTDEEHDKNQYKVLWNAMIFPHLNTTIKGVVWYQGERNNLINPSLYACVFPEMINEWRNAWYEGTGGNTNQTFPFGFVQLAPIGEDFVAERPLFPKIRWEQTANYGFVPNSRQQNVFMAVAMDLPDDQSPYGSIHPRDKSTIAERLILGARSIIYGEDVTYQGPILDNCQIIKIDGIFAAQISYRGVGNEGLVIKSPDGFEGQITGTTEWIPLQIISVTKDKNGVYLSIPTKDISIIRYAWNHRPCDYKECSIYSVQNDLPSPPSICYIP